MNSAGLTGYRVGVYEETFHTGSLYVGCSGDIRITYSTGARVSTINLIGQPSYSTKLDINPGNEHSSRSFRYDMPGAILDSSNYTFSLAKFDEDGDSLTYQLDTAFSLYTSWSNTFQSCAYSAGYSPSNPINGFVIDNLTGQVSYNALLPAGYQYGYYNVVVRTDEWNSFSGLFKGSTYRDVLLLVLKTNSVINPIYDYMDNLSGCKLLDSNEIRACVGDTFCFDVTFSDPDILDSVFISSNLEFIADYYDIQLTGSNPTTASICAVINKKYDYGIDAIIKAWDNQCPAFGLSSVRLRIKTLGPTHATVPACYNTWDTIALNSDSIALWSVLSGDPIISGTNFNCLNSGCTEASLNPFNSTVYLVENMVQGGCSFWDTINVPTDTTFLTGVAVDASQNPVASSMVYLVNYDAQNGFVYASDSTITNANGQFSFVLSQDSFLLKIAPDSALYPNLLPTYYQLKSVVTSADFIQPLFCDTLDVVHQLLSGSNPGGQGFIGGFVSQGAGRGEGDPVVGLPIVLLDNTGQPAGRKLTNASGYFRFEGLAIGTYMVFVDKWSIDNGLAPTVELTVEELERDSLEFVLQGDYLKLIEKPNGIQVVSEPVINVYPNPVDALLSIESEIQLLSISVSSVRGEVLLRKNCKTYQASIDLSKLSSGVYIIECNTVNGHVYKGKVLLNR
ncbi:MAG: T9SS type A sorting domain-containing protein [Flavobacteriales bacterium]